MEAEYDEQTIRFLEDVWGEGYLSPGGSDEIDRIVQDVNFTNKAVLDLGCGTGGITLYLAKQYDLKNIVGFDVEEPSITIAKNRLNKFSEFNNIEFLEGLPGDLPFLSARFDIVFSKDALIHIEDKTAIAKEIARVLKPGGVFAGCDWLISAGAVNSSDIQNWLSSEGFEFLPATEEQYTEALKSAGFNSINLVSRNDWHKIQVEAEINHIEITRRDELAQEFGEEFLQDQLSAWRFLQVVVEKGELYPMHIFGSA